jgi:predicted dienelactone hydrolase
LIEPGDKYHLFIEDANHMSFITPRALLPGRAEQDGAIFDYTNSASLAFWDAYLKGDARTKSYLQSDALEIYSHGTAKLSRR